MENTNFHASPFRAGDWDLYNTWHTRPVIHYACPESLQPNITSKIKELNITHAGARFEVDRNGNIEVLMSSCRQPGLPEQSYEEIRMLDYKFLIAYRGKSSNVRDGESKHDEDKALDLVVGSTDGEKILLRADFPVRNYSPRGLQMWLTQQSKHFIVDRASICHTAYKLEYALHVPKVQSLLSFNVDKPEILGTFADWLNHGEIGLATGSDSEIRDALLGCYLFADEIRVLKFKQEVLNCIWKRLRNRDSGSFSMPEIMKIRQRLSRSDPLNPIMITKFIMAADLTGMRVTDKCLFPRELLWVIAEMAQKLSLANDEVFFLADECPYKV